MKNIVYLLLAFTLTVGAQQSIDPTFEKEGKLSKVTYFHQDGSIAQKGFLKNKKLHGNWTSYDSSGNKLSMGTYEMGMKNGQWFFWKDNDLIEVIYDNNKIVNVLEWRSDEKVVAELN